jgi:CHAD domain-containing protein
VTSSSGSDRITPQLKQRIRAVFRRLPKALAGDEEENHQLRVGGRRLRVALPLLAKRPDAKRVQRALTILRQLTRAAGVSRDLDVAVALFEEQSRQTGPPSVERTVLRRRLRAARARSRARMAESLLDLEIARLRRDLRAIVSRRGEGLFTVLRRLGQTRDALGQEVLHMLDGLGTRFDPVALHRLRIRLRRLRYVGEVAEVLKGQKLTATDDFKTLQDQLGLVQDTYVLSEWFARQAAAARARSQATLAREGAAQQAWFREASHGHHRAFLALSPATLIVRALAAMGRQARPRGRASGPTARHMRG